MFGFLKKNKKDIKADNVSNSTTELTKESAKKTGYIYQAQDYMGVKPEYFNKDKIKLNKFLTDDEEYRKKLLYEDTYSSQHGINRVISKNSNHLSRYEKDIKAFKEIDNVLNSQNELNSFEYLNKASKLHRINKQQEMINKALKQKADSENMNDSNDKRGLSIDDYKVIVNNMNEQIANISEATRRLLKDEKTKVLNLDTKRMIGDDVNPNITSKFYDSKSDKFGLDAIIDIKNPNEYAELVPPIPKAELFDYANKLVVDNAKLLNAQTQHNANITQHNFDTIMNTRAFTENHARLKDIPPEKTEEYVEKRDDVINLDELTPYNIVKTDMRIRKSDKRNIDF